MRLQLCAASQVYSLKTSSLKVRSEIKPELALRRGLGVNVEYTHRSDCRFCLASARRHLVLVGRWIQLTFRYLNDVLYLWHNAWHSNHNDFAHFPPPRIYFSQK